MVIYGKMNRNNFENYVDIKILNRGYNYYINENIVEPHKMDNNEYFFIV